MKRPKDAAQRFFPLGWVGYLCWFQFPAVHLGRPCHVLWGVAWWSHGYKVWHTLSRQHKGTVELLGTHKAATGPRNSYVSACTHVTDTGSPTHSLDFRHTKTPTQ